MITDEIRSLVLGVYGKHKLTEFVAFLRNLVAGKPPAACGGDQDEG